MLGRRKFLGTLTAGMAASVVPAGAIGAAGFETLRDSYARLINSNLHLMNSAGRVTKARLTALDETLIHASIEQFSILLEGDELHEGTYDLYHPDTGTVKITLFDTTEPAAAHFSQRAYFSKFV